MKMIHPPTTVTLSEPVLLKIAKHFENFYIQNKPPGCGWAVIKNGELLYKDFYGIADISKSNSLHENSVFRIASITKSFVAVAILKLRDSGLLDIDIPISKIFGEKNIAFELGKLTVRQLLSMTGGLPTDDPSADRLLGSSEDQYSKIFLSEPLRVHAGAAKCNYSNLSYMLLGRVISITTGVCALDFILNEVCIPLKMFHTRWIGDPQHCVPGHFLSEGLWQQEPPISTCGDGDTFAGLWSSISDLAIWQNFLSSENQRFEGILKLQSLIELRSPKYKRETTEVKSDISDKVLVHNRFYAFGLLNVVVNGELYVCHSGGLPGYSSHLRWHRESGLGIIAFTNATYSPIWDACTFALNEIVEDLNTINVDPPKLIEQRGLELLELAKEFSLHKCKEILSENVFLDKHPKLIQREFLNLKLNIGEETRPTSISMTAGLEATMNLLSRDGKCIEVVYSLSPFDGGKVQEYKIKIN